MRITVVRRAPFSSFWSIPNRPYSSFSFIACAHGALRYVGIPKTLKKADLVFSKRPLKESFEFSERGRLIDHPSISLCFGLIELLQKKYKKGYRYFRVEYDD